LEDIVAYHYHMEQETGQKTTVDNAVRAWCDQRYIPMIEIIRQGSILDHFPTRSETDLYLWIIHHQHHLQQLCGPTVSQESAAQHFARRRSGRPLERVVQIVKDLFDDPVCELVVEEDEGKADPK
jgi:hypothetical protein